MFNLKLLSLGPYNTFEISLEEESHKIDLYCYCLDNTFFENHTDVTKGLLNFFAMLENWKVKLRNLKLKRTDYLPYDYSDQYIGFLLVSQIDEQFITVQAASTPEYFGWGSNPSQLYLENFTDKSFSFSGKQYTILKEQFITEIETSVMNIFKDFYMSAKIVSED